MEVSMSTTQKGIIDLRKTIWRVVSQMNFWVLMLKTECAILRTLLGILWKRRLKDPLQRLPEEIQLLHLREGSKNRLRGLRNLLSRWMRRSSRSLSSWRNSSMRKPSKAMIGWLVSRWLWSRSLRLSWKSSFRRESQSMNSSISWREIQTLIEQILRSHCILMT